jgi:hypothetical protein
MQFICLLLPGPLRFNLSRCKNPWRRDHDGGGVRRDASTARPGFRAAGWLRDTNGVLKAQGYYGHFMSQIHVLLAEIRLNEAKIL